MATARGTSGATRPPAVCPIAPPAYPPPQAPAPAPAPACTNLQVLLRVVEAAMAWIQEYMVSRYKCERVAVPLATDKDAVAGEPQCDIFVR